MAIEQGLVIREEGKKAMAWVRIERSAACDACSSRRDCNVARGDQEREVEAVNEVNAHIGDRVHVVMDTGSLLKATFMLYLFPILCMILGGIAGHVFSFRLNIEGSLVTVVFTLTGLVLAMLFVRAKGRRMGTNMSYRPRILRIIGHNSVQ
jgi:sigma-E factor negative regulatory protein RseC